MLDALLGFVMGEQPTNSIKKIKQKLKNRFIVRLKKGALDCAPFKANFLYYSVGDPGILFISV